MRFEDGKNSDSTVSLSGSDEEIPWVPTRRRRQVAKSMSSSKHRANMVSDSDASSADSSEPIARSSHTRLRLTHHGSDSNYRRGPQRLGQSVRLHMRNDVRSSTSNLRRSSRLQGPNYDLGTSADAEDEDEHGTLSSSSDFYMPELDSSPRGWKRKRRGTIDTYSMRRSEAHETRRSERTTKTHINMQEVAIDDIYRSDASEDSAQPVRPRIVLVREVFKPVPLKGLFRERHMNNCDTCSESSRVGPLICCQGCSLVYHKGCLGNRPARSHLVTKVGDDDFVLQCRRCINTAQRKDHLAPHQGKCQGCHEVGSSCNAFRKRKTPLQEQKEREENDNQDPVSQVSPGRINNGEGLLFRCTKCFRGFHYHCLPSRNNHDMDLDSPSVQELAAIRYHQHRSDWQCKECAEVPADVGALVAWRPADSLLSLSHGGALTYDMVEEDEKQYLVKWKAVSHLRCIFMPGAWVWGFVSPSMRKAFAKKDSGPRMTVEDAIPEEYTRIDIILDLEYDDYADGSHDNEDGPTIRDVKRAFVKYKGLGYEDAVWETPPTTEEGDRWTDFVTAYNDWILGRQVRVPEEAPLYAWIAKCRSKDFSAIEKRQQPETMVGGKMMNYQIDGLNWLYYQWYQNKNGILADEMGLGKTIQVIAFLAMMIGDNSCFPFLVVVPNSTCPNWRREIKKWAPSLKAVTFFGSRDARELAYKHELFPDGGQDLKAHVVVTSYEAATDESSRRVLKRVRWQGLIVDEGQRLKNDRSLLHQALKALKIPYRILLTGTPLQNNAKELFNLLEFLDDNIDAEKLEIEYADMNEVNIRKLHDLIRPFILRRTKAQVLTFLPPMAQVIVPVSMSVVQKKVYKSILAKNPDLLKALFTLCMNDNLRRPERTNLNNILMQLRKCLCHPFVYNGEIEERQLNAALLHRNLIDASSKLQLLEILLPKLQERRHRVLIFSQFLDMLDIIEDFLVGLGMKFSRLDGNISSMEKQKRIDNFNKDGSDLFAFLLSTRAGGVGINLATADTVIILDPDFNPHQDIQALSRAHRIGQQKKVLCFQLMTRTSVEEKIMQIGRKKMALDHVVIEQLDADEADDKDLATILRHGAAELFADDSKEQDIKYDSTSVDKLLDRSQMESTKTGSDNSAQSQFSFARVWANDQGALEENFSVVESAPDATAWDRILKERERAAAAEAAAKQEVLGRGKRARMVNLRVSLVEATVLIADARTDSQIHGSPGRYGGRRST